MDIDHDRKLRWGVPYIFLQKNFYNLDIVLSLVAFFEIMFSE